MEDIAEVLEQELERAVEVKDRESLHRYIKLLTQNIISRSSYEVQLTELRSDVRLLAETMKEGFKAVDKRFEDMYKHMDKRFEDLYRYMDKRFEAVDKRFEAVDKRFEAVDKRFEDMNKRFNMMFAFMNIGFGIIILITILFKFLQ